MSLAKRSRRPQTWLLSYVFSVFACGFAVWGIRELMFPPTDVCEIEQSKDKNLLDISQVYPIKNNIELIGHVGGEAKSVFVRGDIAFVKLGLELAAFDVQNPANLRRIGYILIPGELIHVDNERKYAYINSSGEASGLWKVDISNLTQMSALHVYKPIDYNYITSIRLFGEEAYVTTRKCEYMSFFEGSIRTRCDDTLHVVDTANPNSLTSCYQGFVSRAKRDFAALNAPELIIAPKTASQDNYVYMAEEKVGLKVYEASNPTQMVEVSSYSPSYDFTEVIAYGSYAFATSAEYQDIAKTTRYALHMFDVSILTDPKDLGELSYEPVILTEFSHYLVTRKQFEDGSWPLGVQILDMSLPDPDRAILAPTQIAEIVNIVVVDNRGYATTRDNRFLILDMSNVAEPIVISSYSLGTAQVNHRISVIGSYAYITVRDVGIRILDISDETSVIDVGTYRMKTIPVGLISKDHYIYIAEWYGDLEIVDVANPAMPIQVSVYNAEDRINGMHIVDNYLFLTAGSSGLQVINISDPGAPYMVSSFITGTFVSGIDIDCPHIYLSDLDNGLFILRSDLILVDQCN
jgi:hypothetical protein